jgi:hypothetical protein
VKQDTYKIAWGNGDVERVGYNRAMEILLAGHSDFMAEIIDREMRIDGKTWCFGGRTKDTIHKMSYVGVEEVL